MRRRDGRDIHSTVGCTLVYVSANSSVDDAGLTCTVKGGSTALTSALDISATATTAEWKSTHVGGTAAPASVAAGTVVSLDFANAAADTRAWVTLWLLVGGEVRRNEVMSIA
ncbi:MAG: hypothetical protein WCF84_05720 [Anaerolineae bacterium]